MSFRNKVTAVTYNKEQRETNAIPDLHNDKER